MLGDMSSAPIQQINLIQTRIVAHFHDFGTKVFHSYVGASVLHVRLSMARSVHIWHERNFHNSQRVDNDVYMNIATAVMSVGMSANDSLMSGKMPFAVFLA